MQFVAANRLTISFDFRASEFVSEVNDLSTWARKCLDCGLKSVIILDVATVGTGNRLGACLAFQHATWVFDQVGFQPHRLISGGGLRLAKDFQALFRLGCDQALVATALLPATK